MTNCPLTENELSLLRIQVIVAVRAGHRPETYFSIYKKLGGSLSLASLLENPRTAP
jgi:hypothetical protein